MGFSKEVATKKVHDKFENEISIRLEDISQTENLAESQRSTSLMNYLLGQKVKESNYKSLHV